MNGNQLIRILIVIALSSLLVSGVAVGTHGAENTDFDVSPDDRSPGATGVSYTLDVEITGPDAFSGGYDSIADPSAFVFAIEGSFIENCAADSGNFDDTEHSVSVVRSGGGQATYDLTSFDWSDNGVALRTDGSGNPEVGVGDTVVFELVDCVAGPEDAGWYNASAIVFGQTDGETVNMSAFSHEFGICEGCESNDEARTELGPPGGATPTATPTPTPSATPTPTPSATPTPTPTPTATETAASPTAESGTEDTNGTPTSGDGAGFGALLGALGLLTLPVIRRLRT